MSNRILGLHRLGVMESFGTPTTREGRPTRGEEAESKSGRGLRPRPRRHRGEGTVSPVGGSLEKVEDPPKGSVPVRGSMVIRTYNPIIRLMGFVEFV